MQRRRQDEIRPFQSPEISFCKNCNIYKSNLDEGKSTLKFKLVYWNTIIKRRVIFRFTYDFIRRRILE